MSGKPNTAQQHGAEAVMAAGLQNRRCPLPPPPLPPRHYVAGSGLGIRQMNNIRRNLVFPPAVPIGRFTSLEPIPLPMGLEHLNHIPPPKNVNGGKDYHRDCGVTEAEERLTRSKWKPHHEWVTPTHLKREQRLRGGWIEFRPQDASDLPDSMRSCFNTFARRWTAKGINVEEIPEGENSSRTKIIISEEEQKSPKTTTRAPLLPYRQSYERFANNLGWKTKRQVFGSNGSDSYRNGETNVNGER